MFADGTEAVPRWVLVSGEVRGTVESAGEFSTRCGAVGAAGVGASGSAVGGSGSADRSGGDSPAVFRVGE